VASNTTTNTNIPGIEQSQLEAQENSSSIIGRPPRSRQPVVIPLTKTSATADFNNSLTKNTSSYAYSNKTYSSKNIYKDQETFAQDSNGNINGSFNTDLTIDTTDIAPFRYKNETPQPQNRISPGGMGFINTTTKIGEMIRQTATGTRKGQLSPNDRVNNTIIEENYRSVASYNEGKYVQQSSGNAYINQSTTHKNIIYSQSSSKTLGELVRGSEQPSFNNQHYDSFNTNIQEYPIVTSPEPQLDEKPSNNAIVNSLLNTVHSKSGYETGSSYEYANNFDENGNSYFVEQPDDYDQKNTHHLTIDSSVSNGMKNMMLSPDSRATINPISPSDSVTSDASSSKDSSKKHKRNIFGSLFGTKSKKEKSGEKRASLTGSVTSKKSSKK